MCLSSKIMLKKLNVLLRKIKSSYSLWLVVLVLVLIALFYWFQWRPAEIRKKCSNFNFREAERVLGGKISGAPNLNKLYRLCLAGNGLKPEALISEE